MARKFTGPYAFRAKLDMILAELIYLYKNPLYQSDTALAFKDAALLRRCLSRVKKAQQFCICCLPARPQFASPADGDVAEWSKALPC